MGHRIGRFGVLPGIARRWSAQRRARRRAPRHQPPLRPRGAADASAVAGDQRPAATPAVRPASPVTSRSAGTAASAPATRPSRSRSSRRSSTTSTPPTPDIQITFEAVPYAGARHPRDRDRLGQPPGHRRPGRHRRRQRVRRPVARPPAAHRQDRLRHEPVPRESTVDFYKVGDQARTGIPFAIYPSELCYQARRCSRRSASTSRRTSTATTTRCPDGDDVPWDYDRRAQARRCC